MCVCVHISGVRVDIPYVITGHKMLPTYENYLTFCKDKMPHLKRPEDAMSVPYTIQRNTS